MTDEPETIREAKAAARSDTARQDEHLKRLWVPFPLAGDDVYLFYGLNSMFQLEADVKAMMPDYREHGLTPFGVIETRLLAGDPSAVKAVLDAGLKRKGDPLPSGGFKPVPAADIDLDDDLPWPISEIVTPALEALAYSWLGRTYAELIEEATAAQEAFLRQINGEVDAA